MHVAVDAEDVGLTEAELDAMSREVTARVQSPVFDGARDLRFRLRQVKGALLCVVAVGFSAGALVTSTATRKTPLEAMVSALDGLPERMQRLPRIEHPAPTHAAVRNTLKRLLG
jgi:hypothetical protein